MELVLATLRLVIIAVVYIRYRYNKSLYETQERVDNEIYSLVLFSNLTICNFYKERVK